MSKGASFPTETIPCPTCGAPVTRIAGSGLRVARVASGLSLRDVAAVVPCSASHLHDVEVGNRRATDRVVEGYAKAMLDRARRPD